MDDPLHLSAEEAAVVSAAIRLYRRRTEEQVRRLRERFGEHAEIARQEVRIELLDSAAAKLPH